MAPTSPKQYFTPLRDNPAVIAVIFASSIGGIFQYGFTVAAMSSPSVFIKELVNETCLQRYNVSLEQWQVSAIWSSIVSVFCIGGLLGTLTSGPLNTRFGRRQILLLNNFTSIIGATLMIFSKAAMSFEMIMAGRFLYGIQAGVSLAAQYLYLVECAPKTLRRMVTVSIFSFSCLGKFSGQLLGISELLGTRERWPWLLGFNAFSALLQLSTLPFLPESPRFLLLQKGDRRACEKALWRLWGKKDYSTEMDEMLEEKAAMQNIPNHSVMELLQNQGLRWQVLAIFIVFGATQLNGVSSVYFYSFDVFRAVGLRDQHLRYASMGTGLCELIASIACCMIIENTGKKVLLFGGYIGMAGTLGLLTVTLSLQSEVSWMPYCSMVLIFIFIVLFAAGPGGATSSFLQILPPSYLAAGGIFGSVTSWLCMFSMGMIFPIVIEKLQHFCFLIFLVLCVGCGLFVKFNVPETKNLRALEITAAFKKMHSRSGEEREESAEHESDANRTDDTKV